ncbi:hypothetical protein DCO48_19480 [Pseudomonas sp. SDI]|uniref:hypothetical protein n=1 Tax=Pseudomonas sp. SDI TaxID=2170734 RepID=UPI000DE6340B|nr:hypothetical protein [Pseudomonas sp. SDI]PWB30736.1 hypothetical protein DCO48_19480 [Pseudomonas sp. SDI]
MKYILRVLFVWFGLCSLLFAQDVPGARELERADATGEKLAEIVGKITRDKEGAINRADATTPQIKALLLQLKEEYLLAAEAGNAVAMYKLGNMLAKDLMRFEGCVAFGMSAKNGLMAGSVAAMRCLSGPDVRGRVREDQFETLRRAMKSTDLYAVYYPIAYLNPICFGPPQVDLRAMGPDERRAHLIPQPLSEQQFRVEGNYLLALNVLEMKGRSGWEEAQEYANEAFRGGCKNDKELRRLLEVLKP